MIAEEKVNFKLDFDCQSQGIKGICKEEDSECQKKKVKDRDQNIL